MMNNTQINCTSSTTTTAEAAATTTNVDDTPATYAASAAGDADATTSTSTAAMPPEFVQLTETRCYIYRAIAAIHDESFNKLMIRLLRQFECAIREGFESAQHSPTMCRKLAHSIIALTDQIHTLLGRRALDSSNTLLYQQRMCFIVATYIACELGAAQERVERERFILERISSMLSFYVEVNDVESGALKENMLRTLVAIPKVFGQANIITVLYSRLFPQWSATYAVFTQVELPDKIYIEYIIIFYCWQRLERDETIRQRILEFAGKFMRPSSTLLFNTAYKNFLPPYNTPRTATRCILDYLNMQRSCTGLRAASRLDNRLSQTNEFILDSDEEKAAAESSSVMASAMAAAITMTITPQPPPAPDPPEFLRVLCENANRLEPVIRAAALYRGIDTLCEVVDLCESDEDVEMFSLDFSVPANVDGNGSNSNDAATLTEDDNVPITRIFPSNLRTYQRSTSGAANSSSAPVSTSATVTATYTMPRIVNSYSCRRDSLHLVSTTQSPLQLVDQCVQTAEEEEEEHQREEERQRQQQQQFSFDDDATSTNINYSNDRLSANTTTSIATELLHAGSSTHYHNHHCHQPSSRNSNSSETSQKKQVTFSSSSEYLGDTSSSLRFPKSHKVIKSSIKRQRNIKNVSITTATSSNDRIESLKWIGRKQHLEDSQRMFSKLHEKKNCDIRTDESLPSCDRRKRRAPDKQKKKSSTKINSMPAPTTTTQLTPTTSNASSGTPTPQPKKRKPQDQQRSLPTPPASTHSSNDTDRRRRLSSTLVDFEQVQEEVKNYKFDPRKFSEKNAADVRFYNNLLKLQRMKLKLRRQRGENVLKAPQKSNSVNKSPQKLKRLRAANTKLQQTIDRLHNDINTICNYAVEATLHRKPQPVVRLKRLRIESLETEKQTDAVDAAEVSANPVKLVKRQWTRRRRRRKGHGWSKQSANKKKLSTAAKSLVALQAEPVSAPELAAEPSVKENSPVKKKLIQKKKAKQSVKEATSNSTASASDTITSSTSLPSDPTTSLAIAPPSTSATASAATHRTAPPATPHTAPARALSNSSQTEPDLCIAAYVTLAVNGESCDEQEATVKQIAQLPTPSPEADQPSVLLAHEIELATSNVPVYLLNGESRDVTTPVPPVSSVSASACDDAASEQ